MDLLKKLRNKLFLNAFQKVVDKKSDQIEQKLEEMNNLIIETAVRTNNMYIKLDQLLKAQAEWSTPIWSTLTTINKQLISNDKSLNDSFSKYVEEIRQLLQVKDISGEVPNFCRIGKKNDGGYVMVDSFHPGTICYSFGICDDVSWDLAMAKRGMDIYMYDHTIDGLPENNSHFHYYKTGVTGIYEEEHPELKTLISILQENGHINEKNLVLKMDIEGAEYDVIQNSSEILQNFSQITLEYHNLLDEKQKEKIQSALKTLNKTHQLVYVHANNYGKFIIQNGVCLPDLLEATYVRKSDWQFKETKKVFPTEIDNPNHPDLPEIILGESFSKTEYF